MNLFIRKLESDFNIEIKKYNASLKCKNTYETDVDGNITTLNLVGVKLKKLEPLSPLAEHLKVLSLYDCAIKKTGRLKEFTELKKLDLHGNPISKLKGIDKLVNLTKLDLSFTEIISTKEIQTLHLLKKLDLECTKISSITDLENLKYLRRVDFTKYN